MGKLVNYVVPVDEIIDIMYGNKLERGGYLEVVVPAIGMADKVTYQTSADLGAEVIVEKNGEASIPKYLGRKIVFTSNFSDYKDTYIQEKTTYTTTTKKNPTPKTHKITFYWRLVKKSKAEKK